MNKHAKSAAALAMIVVVTLTLTIAPRGVSGASLAQARVVSSASPDGPARAPELRSGHEGARSASFATPAFMAVSNMPVPAGTVGQESRASGQSLSPDGWQTIAYEDFEGVFPSSGWSVWDESGDGYERYWDEDDYKPHAGSWSAWPARGGVNGLDPQTNSYPNNMDAWMTYGPFDLSDALDVQTVFYLWRQIEVDYDYIFFGASADGGIWDGWTWDGAAGWTGITLALTDYIGDDTVWVGWYFHSDANDGYAGPFVDDITISRKLLDTPAVSIARSGSDVELSWASVSGADHYEVWYAVNAPYFLPGDDCAASPTCTAVSTTAYRHTGATGNVANNYSYVVLAVDASGRSSLYNRVGEFDYDLTPGD